MGLLHSSDTNLQEVTSFWVCLVGQQFATIFHNLPKMLFPCWPEESKYKYVCI